MYKIIGGDGQEYGPVDANAVRQWVAQGRLNAQTRIREENSPDWKTIGEMPEFAGSIPLTAGLPGGAAPAPGLNPPAATFGGAGSTAARSAVSAPAIGLLVTGGLGVLASVISFFMHLFGSREVPAGLPPQIAHVLQMLNGPIGMVSDLIGLGVSALIVFGALKMKNLQSHGLAFAVSIVAMLPCLSPCCLLGLPFGIWALVVLNKPEVKSQFS